MGKVFFPFLIFLLALFYNVSAVDPGEGSIYPSKPLIHVAVIGASTTGPLIDGVVGSVHKGSRKRFYCHSSSTQGFLGPKIVDEPLSIRNQPGVFPAPIMGYESLSFRFKCAKPNTIFVPIIIRPDGTVIHGQPMSKTNSPQTMIIGSPAQTGIYTLLILPHDPNNLDAQAIVEAAISAQPNEVKTFHLKAFNSNHLEDDFLTAEFIY